MRAFVPVDAPTPTFTEVERDAPTPGRLDLLVRIEAVALNPVDTKLRPKRAGRVLGWDAAGEVLALGAEVQGFAVGDRVFYAGDVTRDGSYAEQQLVDHRVAARRPTSLSAVQAAALPLTFLTAWEALVEQLLLREGQTLLVINGAGGVGSAAIQLAARHLGVTVVATASRPETIAHCEALGADHVINHREPIPAQLEALGIPRVDAILCAHDTARHFDAMAEVIRSGGRISSIVETSEPLPMMKLFGKRVSFSWELMFSRTMHDADDVAEQGRILAEVARLVDEGVLETTLRAELGAMSAETLAEGHRLLESGRSLGKIGLDV